MMDEYINGFVEEVKELLLQLEDDLIALEDKPGNAEIINNIFRVMHTLKGSAGMVGYKNIQDLTHEFETLYVRIRDGVLEADGRIIDITLKAKDLMLSMLENPESNDGTGELIKMIDKFAGQSDAGTVKSAKDAGGFPTGTDHLYLIIFEPDKGVFERGLNPDKSLNELKAFGETYIAMHERKKSWEKQKIEKICHTVWEIYLRTPAGISDVEGTFLFYDPEEYKLFELHADLPPDHALFEKLQVLYKRKVNPEEHLKKCVGFIPEKKSQPVEKVEYNNAEIKSENKVEDAVKVDNDSMVNVSSHKLDELMNLVSELVTLTATMQATAINHHDLKLNNSLENIEKLTKRFRNNALDLRLVPVGMLLTKFKRQVRDLSKELNKKVNLLIEGQDIEIDKTILKSIESPLQHIIRNSIDHGLEPESERLVQGKSAEGLLKITAFYSGASVVLQVQDDGRGIDLERVRECAIKKGYIQADQAVTKEELITFILEPGFTTNENITIVSGRGVGMDVVRKELSSVGGSLEVFTEKNLGTSITMKLPTTLTIIDTLMVEIAETQILIPVMDIEYCFKETGKILFNKDNLYIQYKNNPIPLISLRDQFRYPASDSEVLMVIVINKFDRRYAIIVDRIVGEHQAVIKPLGDLFINQPFFSGGSIMVNGKLAFILDTNFLFNQVTKFQQ